MTTENINMYVLVDKAIYRMDRSEYLRFVEVAAGCETNEDLDDVMDGFNTGKFEVEFCGMARDFTGFNRFDFSELLRYERD